jgi:dipeptidyl aminopeptidase/acylaminoacyl peptidase
LGLNDNTFWGSTVMTRLFPRLLAGLSFLLVSLIGVSAQAQTPPPVSAFLWEMRNVQISPDGQYISMIQPYEGRTALVVYPVGGGEPTVIEGGQRAQDENLEVATHFWSGDRIVVTVNWNDHYQSRYANFRLEQERLLSVRPDGRDVQVLFESRQGDVNDIRRDGNIIDTLPDEDDHILVGIWERVENVGFQTVAKVDITTGRSVRVAQGTADTLAWASDSNGNIVARTDLPDDNQLRMMVRSPGSHNWHTVYTRSWFSGDEGQATLSPITVLDGGRTLYFYSNHEGRIGVYKMDISSRGGGAVERVFLHDWVDVEHLDYSPDDDKLIGVVYTVHSPREYYFDEEARADIERYADLLAPGSNQVSTGEPGSDRDLSSFVSVTSETDDQDKRILVTYGPGDPPVYYLMDDNTRSISELGQRYPGLSPENLGTTSVMTYAARDGREIPGYLTLPPGRSLSDGPMPFVLWPHGGPNARDAGTFDLIRQFLATRGYAVFAPQFRGSRGFGNEFLAAGFREWGDAMQDDLTDATQFMIDQGIADPDHMCIVGWSYSAYAAIYATIDTPDLYNCAVTCHA